jgi:hypothetical protein
MKVTLVAIWKWVKWPFFVLVFLYAVLVGWRAFWLFEEEKTAEAVASIHADRLEWGDINGKLPPEPDPVLNNETLTGVDSNTNGIRDDVERAIYLKYKDQQRLVVAMLQYAKALQKEFTDVYNSETLVAVIQEQSRGALCILKDEPIEEVRDLVFNTKIRNDYSEQLYEKYMTSYGLPSTGECDLEF